MKDNYESTKEANDALYKSLKMDDFKRKKNLIEEEMRDILETKQKMESTLK